MPTLAAAASGESCECVRLINRVQGFTATKIKARFFFYKWIPSWDKTPVLTPNSGISVKIQFRAFAFFTVLGGS
jgi:hypothetical protein